MSPEPTESFRPFLQIATFCEKVLQEKDSVFSVIRMIDRLIHHGPDLDLQPFMFQFAVVILFKAGFVTGRHKLSLKPISPTGRALPELGFQIHFEGEDRGAGIASNIGFLFEEEGLYWFEVWLNDELTTKIPMRILYRQVGTKLDLTPPPAPGSP